jgi:5-carboxymethyl-2-hydroxymuconic-semialdehyde dehydrogenase/aminomuconate-semialdehyde/2-hydroxymuconate-6-semialdehyde dehydrogenase
MSDLAIQRSLELDNILRREQASFIGGKFVQFSHHHRVPVYDPATDQRLGDLLEADRSEVDLAARTAREAFEDGRWSGLSVEQRQNALMKIHDALIAGQSELADIESATTGIPLAQMKGFYIPRSAYNFKFFAEFVGQVGGDLYTQEPGYVTSVFREPVGVAGLLGPWNAPVTLCSMKIAAAIAFGNTCVVKPSEIAAAGMQRFMEILHNTGLPPGVVNLVNGRGPITGTALVEHPDINVVSFTGGTTTGRAILASAAKGIKPCTMELGGKSASIICADSDIDRALDAALLGIYGGNGQQCLAGSRILVEKSIEDKFIEAFVARVKNIKMGHPSQMSTEMGPLASKAHMERVLSYVDIAKADGAEILTGGKRVERMGNGYYIEPTVVRAKSNASRVCQEEIFGPFATFVTFDNFEEALTIANDSTFGLVAYVWTSNLDKANLAMRKLRTGTVWVNTPVVRDLRSAFGGYRESGIGREGGKGCMALYTEEKTTMVAIEKMPIRKLGMSS